MGCTGDSVEAAPPRGATPQEVGGSAPKRPFSTIFPKWRQHQMMRGCRHFGKMKDLSSLWPL
jgi:hypothetical protein